MGGGQSKQAVINRDFVSACACDGWAGGSICDRLVGDPGMD